LILVHYKNGMTRKLDPFSESELCLLDSPEVQKEVSRVAIVDGDGHRVDLPSMRGNSSRVWVELVRSGEIPKGERVCMLRGRQILRVTLFYSDGRIVIDL